LDAAEAEAPYNLLEREVIPEFYTRNEPGDPYSVDGRDARNWQKCIL